MSIQDYFDQSCEDEPEQQTGGFLAARGIFKWQEGDEPAEVTIRKLRDGDNTTQQELDDYHRLLAALENLRQIPSWATIQLGTDIPCCPYTVFIREGDVGGELILSTSGTDLIATLEAAYQQYLLFNREYALKVKGHGDE